MNIKEVYINSLKEMCPCRVVKENPLSVILEVKFPKHTGFIKKNKRNLITELEAAR